MLSMVAKTGDPRQESVSGVALHDWKATVHSPLTRSSLVTKELVRDMLTSYCIVSVHDG